MNQFRAFLINRRRTILVCVSSVFLWGLIAHAYGFLHTSLSHDALNAFFSHSVEEATKIRFGRFLIPVYRNLIRGPFSLPWLIGLISLCWTTVSVFLVNELLENKNHYITVLIAGIMTTNITFIAQIATYIHEFDVNAFALLLAVCAVCCWRWVPDWRGLLLGAVCIMGSAGFYQSYLTVAVSLIIWISIMDLFAGKDSRTVFYSGIRGVALLILGVLLYYLAGSAIYKITGITSAERTDIFSGSGLTTAITFDRFKKTCGELWRDVYHQAYNNSALLFFLICMLLTLAALAAVRLFSRQLPLSNVILICLLVVALPFGMNFLFFLMYGSYFHDLMNYSSYLFYVFCADFAYRQLHFPREYPRLQIITKALVSLTLITTLSLNISLANTAYVKKELESQATFSVMTLVQDKLNAFPGYVPGETPVAFFGTPGNMNYIPEFETVSIITGLHATDSLLTDTSTPYYNSYAAYFRYILQRPIQMCPDEVHAQLRDDPRVQSMPVYPADGSIAMIDDVLVVNFGISQPAEQTDTDS